LLAAAGCSGVPKADDPLRPATRGGQPRPGSGCNTPAPGKACRAAPRVPAVGGTPVAGSGGPGRHASVDRVEHARGGLMPAVLA